MKNTDLTRLLVITSCIAVASVVSASVMAQEGPSAVLEEIVVTARQRAENLQDVPDATPRSVLRRLRDWVSTASNRM